MTPGKKKESIHFFFEDIELEITNKAKLKKWVAETIKSEGFLLKEINIICCSDAYLLGLNQTYLSHNTLTDVITFDHSEKKRSIEADVFISVERVRENAVAFHESEEDELHRVMIHGILHLCGYKDHSAEEKLKMRSRENFFLERRGFI